jgi:hypothetical protein
LSVSAAAARERRPRSQVLTDADLLRLFGRDQTSIRLLLYVRVLAKGDVRVRVHNHTLEKELGIDRRTVQRAKARIREAGVGVLERTLRHGGDGANLFVIDRRRVSALQPLHLVRAQEAPGGGANAAPFKEENLSHTQPRTSAGVCERPPERSRAGPAAFRPPDDVPLPAATTAHADVDEFPAPLPAAVTDADPPTLAVVEAMRRFLAKRKAGSDEPAALSQLLDRAVAFVVKDGTSEFVAALARRRLEAEHWRQLHQLQLGGGEVPSVEGVDDGQASAAGGIT